MTKSKGRRTAAWSRRSSAPNLSASARTLAQRFLTPAVSKEAPDSTLVSPDRPSGSLRAVPRITSFTASSRNVHHCRAVGPDTFSYRPIHTEHRSPCPLAPEGRWHRLCLATFLSSSPTTLRTLSTLRHAQHRVLPGQDCGKTEQEKGRRVAGRVARELGRVGVQSLVRAVALPDQACLASSLSAEVKRR